MTDSQKLNIEVIQYLRGIAALMVVMFHASSEVRDIFGFSAFAWGAYGVDVFFVISGFVMIYSIRATKTKVTPIIFLKKRILRVVPMYWLSTGLMALAIAIRPDLFKSATLTKEHLLQSLLFIPHFDPKIEDAVSPILVPGWTLNYEMYFYLILSMFVACKARARVTLVTAVLIVGFTVGSILERYGAQFKFLANSIVFEFLLGMVVCEAYLRGFTLPVKFAKPVSLFSLLALVLVSNMDFRFASAGLCSALLVHSLVSLNLKFKGMTRSFLNAIGDSSYSLYLSHIFVIGLVSVAWRNLFSIKISENYLTASLYLILCSLFSIFFGYIIFKTVENNLIKLSLVSGRFKQ